LRQVSIPDLGDGSYSDNIDRIMYIHVWLLKQVQNDVSN